MICTIQEYCATFPAKGKKVTPRTIIKHAIKGLLPTNHVARKLPVGNGVWVIEIKQ
jgi:ribosomal protein L13